MCQGPRGEAATLKETSKSEDSAPGQKTAENFFLTGKYREQKTGVFKGKKAVRIFQGKKQPACQ